MPNNDPTKFEPFLFSKKFGTRLLKLEGAVIRTSDRRLMTAPSNFNKLVPNFLLNKNGSNFVGSLLGTIWSYAENPSIFSKIVLRLVYSIWQSKPGGLKELNDKQVHGGKSYLAFKNATFGA